MSWDQSVRGIVLAGSYPAGQGRAGASLIGPLSPVAQKPLISYVLRWLYEGGVRQAAVCLNEATRHVRGLLGDNTSFALDLEYCHDDTPRGPAGCVRDAGLALGGRTFVVAEGALIPTGSVVELLNSHKRSGAILTIALDQDRRQLMGGDRPASPAGLYVFDRRAFEFIPAQGFQDIKEALIPRLYEAGEVVQMHVVPGVSVRIRDEESYLLANEWLVQRAAAWHPGSAGLDPGVHTRPSRCGADVRIIGPVVFGPGVKVMARATIVGPTSIGAGTTIGSGALVSRSVLWARCNVGAEAVVDRGLLAEGAVVEPGARIFNAVRVSPPQGRTRPGWLRRFVRQPAAVPRRVSGGLPAAIAARRDI